MNAPAILAVVLAAFLLGGCAFAKHPRFGRLPQGERLERVRKSPNYVNGEFRNQVPTPMAMGGGRETALSVLLSYLFKDRDRRVPRQPVPAFKADLKSLPADRDLMVWFGHSSYLIQAGGRRILVDPVFHDASPVSFSNPPYPGTDLYGTDDMPDSIDVLVITHDHWDHLDHRTVTELRDRVGKVVVPLGVGEHFQLWGYGTERIVELDWNETAEVAGLSVHCLPARHFSGRLIRRNQTLWASYLLEVPPRDGGGAGARRRRIYMGGDGGYGPHFKRIGSDFEGIDLAILENGQYDEAWPDVHTRPRWLGQVVKDLRPRRFATVHNSRFCLSRHPWDEPQANQERASEESGVPLLKLVIGVPAELFPAEGGCGDGSCSGNRAPDGVDAAL